MRVIARDARVRVVVVGDGEDVVANVAMCGCADVEWLAGTDARECRGWWESAAWGMRMIARDARVRVVVVGDGEGVIACRRHVRVRRRRLVDGNGYARVARVVCLIRVGRAG